MVMVSLNGKMDVNTKANSFKIFDKATVFIHGRTAVFLKETSFKTNNTGLEPTLFPKMSRESQRLNSVCGRMEKE